ncbi:(E)-beta-ocimene synthase, chloroplastic-like, partial [Phalaenopsis equestris]
MGTYDTMNGLAIEGKDVQGIDVFPYLHDLRKKQVQQYLMFREVKDKKQFKNFEDYVHQVKRGIAVAIRLVPAMFLMGDVAPDKVLKLLDQKSTILDYLDTYIALMNLVTEERVAISLYMKEQNYSVQEAKAFLEEKIDETFANLTQEYLKPNNHISHFHRRLIFEH